MDQAVDQATHSSFSRRPPADEAFDTDFDAAALAVSKLSAPATGPAAPPLADPVAGCASPSPLPKTVLMGALRAAITKIEGHELCGGVDHEPAEAAWQLGCPVIDRLLPRGLDAGGVHEVKAAPRMGPHSAGPYGHSASAGDWMTGLGFALRLAVRRTMMARAHTSVNAQDAPWMLWCWPRSLAAEFGAPSARGLAELGLDPSRLLIVEAARASDALVALEDGLKSSSLGLAFGIFDEIALTPARRLSLAAGATGTPCLLITHPSSPASGATATRWRVGRMQSAPHAYDAPREGTCKGSRAPGNARFSVGLERCRSAPQSAQRGMALLEWCDETRTFSLASRLAYRAPQAGAGDGSSDGSTRRHRSA